MRRPCQPRRCAHAGDASSLEPPTLRRSSLTVVPMRVFLKHEEHAWRTRATAQWTRSSLSSCLFAGGEVAATLLRQTA